jgi:hypothetical protein
MQTLASSFLSLEPESRDAGRLAGEALAQQFADQRLRAAVIYATVNHDQAELLEAFRAVVGPDVNVLGCSVQGLVSDGRLTEEGVALGVMGFGGAGLRSAIAIERDIGHETKDKGRSIGRKLKHDLGEEPKLVVVLYDPLSGVDVEGLLAGMRLELSCPLVGGGASQPWGPTVQTFQYWGEEVLSHGVVALALSGPFSAEIGICHGSAPLGLTGTITKAVGNQVFEIDGRPAVDVWIKATGCDTTNMFDQTLMASWALGLERRYMVDGPEGPREEVARVIRGAFGFGVETGAIVFQAAIPEGTRVMVHHRTVENMLNGTTLMAKDLARRVSGRKPWAVLGFECGARTYPFLGEANTRKEHAELRELVAPRVPWLGMMAWGEIGPCGGETAFHNYTYPLVVLTE